MNPQESEELRELMDKLRSERDISLLLIEHDMKVVMNVSDHITVLDGGEKIAVGLAAGGAGQPARHRGLPREPGMSTGNGANGATPVLEVEDIHTFYGSIEALKGISLTVNEGEIVTLIGSNGAGKSTTLRSISGLNPPKIGTIKFRGKRDPRPARLPGGRAGDRAVAGGPPRLLAHDGAREPRDGRVHPQRRRTSPTTSSASTSCSRA